MIYESHYWKKYLESELLAFLKILNQRKYFNDSLYFEFEKFILISAFISRKLIESNKITDDIAKKTLRIQEFELMDEKSLKKILVYRDDINKHYNINKLIPFTSINTKKLLNIIIHSYFIEIHFTKNDWKDLNKIKFVINSDRTYKNVVSIKLVDYIEWIKLLTQDEVKHIIMTKSKTEIK